MTIESLVDQLNQGQMSKLDFPYAVDDLIMQKIRIKDHYDYSQLNAEEKYLVWVVALEAQVNNGGFDQYFFNSSGDFAMQTVDALRAIGAQQNVALLTQALSVFPAGEVPSNWSERQDHVLNFTSQDQQLLEDLDLQFFQYPEDLAALMQAYILDHIDSFI